MSRTTGARRRRLFLSLLELSLFGEREKTRKEKKERKLMEPSSLSPSPLRPPFAALSPRSNCGAILSGCLLGPLLVAGRGNGRNRRKEGTFCSVFFLPWRKRSSELPAPAEIVFPRFFSVAIPRAKWRAFCFELSHPIPTDRFYGSSLRLCRHLVRFRWLTLTDSTFQTLFFQKRKKKKTGRCSVDDLLLGHPFTGEEKKKALENGSRHVGQHGLLFRPQGLRRGRAVRQQVTRAVR